MIATCGCAPPPLLKIRFATPTPTPGIRNIDTLDSGPDADEKPELVGSYDWKSETKKPDSVALGRVCAAKQPWHRGWLRRPSRGEEDDHGEAREARVPVLRARVGDTVVVLVTRHTPSANMDGEGL